MTMWSALARLAAAIGEWLFSARRIEKAERKATEKAADSARADAFKGDEAAVNKRLSRLLHAAVVTVGVCWLTGCAARVVYVPATERAMRMEHAGVPGWWLPDAVMADVLEKLERAEAAGVR